MPIWDVSEPTEPLPPLNREEVLKEVKEQLPEPWMWHTVQTRIIEGKAEQNPRYDILVSKRKVVNEEIAHEVRFGQAQTQTTLKSNYSIVLGVIISDDMIEYIDDQLVTATVIIRSSIELLNMLREIDKKGGGVVR